MLQCIPRTSHCSPQPAARPLAPLANLQRPPGEAEAEGLGWWRLSLSVCAVTSAAKELNFKKASSRTVFYVIWKCKCKWMTKNRLSKTVAYNVLQWLAVDKLQDFWQQVGAHGRQQSGEGESSINNQRPTTTANHRPKAKTPRKIPKPFPRPSPLAIEFSQDGLDVYVACARPGCVWNSKCRVDDVCPHSLSCLSYVCMPILSIFYDISLSICVATSQHRMNYKSSSICRQPLSQSSKHQQALPFHRLTDSACHFPLHVDVFHRSASVTPHCLGLAGWCSSLSGGRPWTILQKHKLGTLMYFVPLWSNRPPKKKPKSPKPAIFATKAWPRWGQGFRPRPIAKRLTPAAGIRFPCPL